MGSLFCGQMAKEDFGSGGHGRILGEGKGDTVRNKPHCSFLAGTITIQLNICTLLECLIGSNAMADGWKGRAGKDAAQMLGSIC